MGFLSQENIYYHVFVYVHRTVTSPFFSHTTASVSRAQHCKIGNSELNVNSLQTWLCPYRERCWALLDFAFFLWALVSTRSVASGDSSRCRCMVLLITLVAGHCVILPHELLKQTGQEHSCIFNLQSTTCTPRHFSSFKNTGIEKVSVIPHITSNKAERVTGSWMEQNMR